MMKKVVAFENLGLSQDILKSILELGFEEPTPIQSQTIPIILANQDLVGQAITGSGKTAAFGLPAVDAILPNVKVPQVLVLCPTRELAVQTAAELAKFAKHKSGINVLAIYGGQPIDRQFRELRKGVQIVVGTPGRIIDHLERGSLDLTLVRLVVLDEADEMLNMGFRDDLESILQDIPKNRQTALFSATISSDILHLSQKYLKKDAQIIKVAHEKLTAPKVEQFYFEVDPQDKLELLGRLLDLHNPKRAIVFCNTKVKVDDLAAALRMRNYKVEGIHGDLNQTQRDRVMARFKNLSVEVLVATGVAARGLDISDVEIVVNFDVPMDEESYVHRIGRTGRAGHSGRAFSFVSRREFLELKDIIRYTKATITKAPMPTLKEIIKGKEEKFINSVKDVVLKCNLESQIDSIKKFLEENSSINIEIFAAALLKLLQGKDNIASKRMVTTEDIFENYRYDSFQEFLDHRFSGSSSGPRRGGHRGGRSFGGNRGRSGGYQGSGFKKRDGHRNGGFGGSKKSS